MIENINRLFLDLERYQRGLRRGTEALALEYGNSIRARVANANKFKTGRSAASWNLSVSRILTKIAPEGQRSNLGTAASEGKTEVAGFSLGKTLHVSNVIDYIQRVDREYKPGFVRGGFTAGVEDVKGRARTIFRVAFRATR